MNPNFKHASLQEIANNSPIYFMSDLVPPPALADDVTFRGEIRLQMEWVVEGWWTETRPQRVRIWFEGPIGARGKNIAVSCIYCPRPYGWLGTVSVFVNHSGSCSVIAKFARSGSVSRLVAIEVERDR